MPVADTRPSEVIDTFAPGGSGGTIFYIVAAVDGRPVEANARDASMRASRGLGRQMLLRQVSRFVAPGPHEIKVKAATTFAAPIEYLVRAGSTFEASTTLRVEIQPGRRYRVMGVLDALRRELWIEDADTEDPVSERYIDRETDVATGRYAPTGEAYYACCNLHYEGDWISDANYADQNLIPLGTRLHIGDRSAKKAEIWIDGRRGRLGLDYGREVEKIDDLIARIAVKADPRPQLAAMPLALQDAIRAGRLMTGMSREQVVLAIGHPRKDLNPDRAALTWLYALASGAEFSLRFGDDGLLREVEADLAVKLKVMVKSEIPPA